MPDQSHKPPPEGEIVQDETPYPDLVAAVERGLRAENDTWDKSSIHSSDLAYGLEGERCGRQLWLRLRGAPQREHHAGELFMFDRGRSAHERLTQLIRPHLPEGWSIEYVERSIVEDEVARQLGLVPEEIEDGTLDVELHGPGGIVVIVDYKTLRGRAFEFLTGPYTSHEIQIRSYIMARDAHGGIILYADREGQNFCRQFRVTRDDAAVRAAAQRTHEIGRSQVQPPAMLPILDRRANKGPDSVYLREPWQCQRCVFRDHSCPGALPPDLRDLGIVAKITKDGEMIANIDNTEALETVERLLLLEHAPAAV